MVKKPYPIIYIAKPKLKIIFDCVFCSAKYKTTDVIIIHKCTGCGKQNTITSRNYSISAINFYLTMAIANLKHNDGIILRATDSFILLLQSLVSYLTTMGMKVVKDHKITDEHIKKQKEIIVNEVVLEKIGAIK